MVMASLAETAVAQKARPTFSVENLSISFARDGQWNSVVRNLSFEIAPGETLAIVGESGSGKSVTALSILGLLPDETSRIEGSIKLGDTDLLTLSPKQLKSIRGNDIAMIFQEPMTSLNPTMCIGEQIAESIMAHQGLRHREAKEAAVRLMERVKIPGARRRYSDFPHQFLVACASA